MKTFIKRMFHDRRGATAMALAILFIPLMIAAGAAVDLSRIASARALLQASTDAAAIAGAGAWQTSESYSYASSVTTAAYTGTASQLPKFVSTSTPTPSLTCTGSTTQCGGAAGSSSYVTTTSTYGCPAAAEYCVAVKATGTLKNSILGFLIPSETLTATSIATTAFPPETLSGKNIPPSPGFGSAGDISGIYAYAVPMSGTGSSATPQYTQIPQPNSSCSNYATLGPLALENLSSAASTTCNYLFIALSTSSGTAGAGGSITLQQNQPIAFNFINDTGANGYTQLDGVNYTTNLMVKKNNSAATFYPNGSISAYSTTVTTITCDSSTSSSHYSTSSGSGTSSSPYPCASSHQSSSTGASTTSSSGTVGTTSSCPTTTKIGSKYYCYVATSTAVTTTSISVSAQCPDHTLYGSISPGYGSPVSDSLNEYSSAFEVIGYPPTYETNHVLTPFVTNSSAATTTTLDDGTTYTVNAVCPNFSIPSGSTIKAPITTSYATSLVGSSSASINIFSTAFPGQTYTDSTTSPSTNSSGIALTTGSGDIFPPTIASCTPATYAEDGHVTPVSSNPWWNWNPSNSGNCSNESSTNQASYLSSGQPAYGNCALIIQAVGTSIPVNSNNQALLPDYYLLVKTSGGTVVGLDPIWNGTTFTDQMPGVITSQLHTIDSNISISGTTVTDNDTAATYTSTGTLSTYGYVPTATHSYTLSSGTYAGDTVVFEIPASTSTSNSTASYTEFHLPPETSHQCYNPQANGNTGGSATIQEGAGASITFATTGDNNNGTAIDPIANPQLGAILCNSNPPETYALYWNDLGTYESDDLGEWNAVVAFTCSVPGSGTNGGGPATLSG